MALTHTAPRTINLGSVSEGVTKRCPIAIENLRQVRNILSGSPTPACDLLVLVDDGYMTAHEATQALKATGRKIADVHSCAAAEREHMRRLDC